ncbi:energy transducer TonB [Sphingopyxis sp. H115]|uniref:energy transducer TonB n=1 Tax=Sphingopyxis sp. H115 TaxID=1759073 RepID=UPI00128F6F23|nr:energy transducer TonB [Sphingopyxis sp. H115]
MMRIPCNCLAISAIVLPAEGLAAPATWEPHGSWQLNQQREQCTLLRRFQSGDRYMVLQIKPDIFSVHFDMILAGPAVPAQLTEGAANLLLPGHTLPLKIDVNTGTAAGSQDHLLRWNLDDRLEGPMPSDQPLRLDAADGFTVTLPIPGAEKALNALRNCQDEVASIQGIEAGAYREQTRPPVPANNPGYWATDADYPPTARRERMEGIVGFRMTVAPDGSVSDCQITSSSGFDMLDKRTCLLLKQRAQFKPALGANGQPTVSYYSNRVRWAIP